MNNKVYTPPVAEEEVWDSVIDHLPQELFVKSTYKAFIGLSITLTFLIAGYILLAIIPWFFLPLAWLLLGFSYTAMFSIGHDCSRGSFSKFPTLNSIVGSIVSLPLLLPYESWSIQENDPKSYCHVKNLWNGLWTSVNTWIKASIAGLPNIWRPGNRKRIVLSLLWVYMLAVVIFGTMIKALGVWGLIKFWLFPWLAYHFWMSTFYSGVFHVPFVNGVSVRVTLSFPTKVPRWINFLTSDIASAISVSKPFISLEKLRRNVPNRNLRKALNLILEKFNERESQKPEIFEVPEINQEMKVIESVDKKSAFTEKVENISDAYGYEKVNYFDLKNVNWIPTLWILLTPVLSLIGFIFVPIRFETLIFSIICYIGSGLGITVGYHRLFAHRSYSCSRILRGIILLCGTSALQGSCLWWARDHRAHHRYVDTRYDPYNSKRGFFWAHMGWLLVKQDKSFIGKTDCQDLESDPVLVWQDKYFLPLSIFLAVILPTCISGLCWGDWLGGFFFASIARSVLVMQSTFCINSLAHYAGSLTFSDAHTPRDCWWVSLLTFGEGYHNFHHEFPYDYRNGVDWYSFDPSKWTIWLVSLFSLTYDLKRFPQNEIEKGRLQMIQKRIQKKLDALYWGPKVSELPGFTLTELKNRGQEGSNLIAIDGFVIDVSEFIHHHPGGQAILKAYVGKDATRAFHGAVYAHSNGANNLIATMRVGKIVEATD